MKKGLTMKIKGNLLIFSADNQERVDVRKVKEKKLQVILDENNELPKFEVNNKEYIKKSAENEIEQVFEVSNFYIEQLYTWGDPNYYTNSEEILVIPTFIYCFRYLSAKGANCSKPANKFD